MEEKVIAVININSTVANSLMRLKQDGINFEVVALRDVRTPLQDRSHSALKSLQEAGLPAKDMETDFFDEVRLKSDLEPLHGRLLGVVSRGESSMQYLARLSTACRGWGLVLPESQSLEVAIDKQRMRQRFTEHAPEVTPAFMRVQDSSERTMQLIEEGVGYPLVIKPANLASSLLIQKCDMPEQAERAIAGALQAIRGLYDESGRYEEPVLIVEQMLEGDLYSVDAYITADGEILYCPAVEYVTGQSIGIDDFFLYRRSAPTHLESADWDACKLAVERGIRALSLTATTAHVELCRTKGGWKIIEVGPRMGRYRTEMYREAYGIEHSDNDIRIRLGMRPTIPTDIKAFCSVYSLYPSQEGVLRRIDNVSGIHGLQSLVYVHRSIEDGATVRHAKHGGHALMEVILASEDREQFEKDCAWFEKNVRAVVE